MEAKTCAASLPMQGATRNKRCLYGLETREQVQNYVPFNERILAEVLEKGMNTQQQHKTIFPRGH